MKRVGDSLSSIRATGFLARLRGHAQNASESEKQATAYICKNAARIPFVSVHQLAATTGVSVSTLSRLTRRLGYANFREFKIDLAQEMASSPSAVYRGIQQKDSDEAAVRKIFEGNIQSIQNTLKMLNVSHCLRAVKEIQRAERVVCFGVGSSGFVAQEAALRLSLLAIQAEAYSDSYQMLVRAARLHQKQMAIGISHSGRSEETVEALRLARERGAMTLGISNYPQSPLRNVSSIFFCTAFEESGVHAAALSAIVAQICLVDVLYVLLARHGKGSSQIDRINRVIEDFFRIPDNKTRRKPQP